ncbi:diguanylate cyclase [Fusibacter bizertensis]|uniref:Diguanylate cyclase n=1 Tax=Fusibacter bizertensis TaxID=1488331 RepID=A0ABT6NBJ1_9FIRM|nr:diguanylate cyclase [Fusibacter bizertensis]MDH8677795.1 diguanylate cyclase [Fusibacter bizertensis]
MRIGTYINSLIEQAMSKAFEDPQFSFELALEAQQVAIELNLEVERGKALFQMAYACRVMSKHSEGLNYAFKALEIMKKEQHIQGIYRAKNIIGIIYFYYGDLTDALENFMSALDLVSETNDINLKTSILNNIGEVYREAGEYEKARVYYEQALSLALELDLKFNASAIYLNIGEVLYQEGKFEESNVFLEKGYLIVLDENRLLEQGEAETKIGRAFVAQGKYIAAKETFLSALDKLKSVNNKYYMVDLLMEMADLDVAVGLSPLRNLNEALDLSILSGIEKKIVKIYENISFYYEKKGDYKSALEYYKNFHLKQSELEASNLSKRLEILSVEFNYYKEKSENLKFKKLSEKLERDIDTYNKTLENVKAQNQSLLKESLYDELTEVYNRRGLEVSYQDLFTTMDEILGSVFIIDIDRFKNFNDTWGHVKGDECLKKITESLNKNISQGILARFGGEEFVVITQLKTLSEATNFAQQLRKSIESESIQAEKNADKVVTISIGGYLGKLTKDNLMKHIEEADKELYIAKENGRNCISVREEAK